MHRVGTFVNKTGPLVRATCGLIGRQAAAACTNQNTPLCLKRYAATTVAAEPFLNGSSSQYVEDMYNSWVEDPKSVHKVSTHQFVIHVVQGWTRKIGDRRYETRTAAKCTSPGSSAVAKCSISLRNAQKIEQATAWTADSSPCANTRHSFLLGHLRREMTL